MPFVQLKLHISFRDYIRSLMELDALILCEGPSDAEVLKLVVDEPDFNLGVTDCDGVRGIYEIGRYVTALIHLSRKLRALGVLINADEYELAERAEALASSLREHGLRVGELKLVSEALFRVCIEQKPFIICVAGLKDVPVDKHCIEDHLLEALISAGDISLGEVKEIAEMLRQTALIRCETPRVSAKDVLETLGLELVGEVKRLLRERPGVIRDAFRLMKGLIEELQRCNR